MALFFDYYIILASDWSIVRSQYTPSRSTSVASPLMERQMAEEFWTLDVTSRRLTDFTAALTPRGLVFCNDFWMPFGCVGEHSRCCVDIHVVICSGYDNIFVTFNFYLH